MNSDQTQLPTGSKGEERGASLFGHPSGKQPLPSDAGRPRRLTAEGILTDTLLSHAIEYLTDDRQIPSGKVTELWPEQPDVQAILILMEARQRLYLDSPMIERRSLLGFMGTFKGPDRRRR